MGFIEEGRQLIQDFVAPEIRALEVRIDAVEKKIDSLEARMEKRFDSIERRFDSIDAKLERNQGQIMDALHRMENYHQLAERVAKIESKLQHVA
jgi:tetrahydromethanopterin S-methyltransferase subunit G